MRDCLKKNASRGRNVATPDASRRTAARSLRVLLANYLGPIGSKRRRVRSLRSHLDTCPPSEGCHGSVRGTSSRACGPLTIVTTGSASPTSWRTQRAFKSSVRMPTSSGGKESPIKTQCAACANVSRASRQMVNRWTFRYCRTNPGVTINSEYRQRHKTHCPIVPLAGDVMHRVDDEPLTARAVSPAQRAVQLQQLGTRLAPGCLASLQHDVAGGAVVLRLRPKSSPWRHQGAGPSWW